MPASSEIPAAVFWIWGATLALVVVVIVPLALHLLMRTLRAAIAIERYTRETLEAGVGVAENTAAIKALDETIAAATAVLEAARALEARALALEEALGGRR